MHDTIFGSLITDELKLIRYRAHRSGLQHNYATDPLDPKPDKPVAVIAKVGSDLDLDEIVCYYTTNGTQPDTSNDADGEVKTARLSRSRVEWDTLSWGYMETWRGEIPAQPEGTLVRYRIVGMKGGKAAAYADWPEPKFQQELATRAHFANTPIPEAKPEDPLSGKIFSYHVTQYPAPDWAREAVIYHIFSDRFHPGIGREWTQTAHLSDFCGGTLWGIRDKLDHISELGATAIWLSPTWPSTSYHGYDVTDYQAVSKRLGGEEAMHALIKEAHTRGIKIILDLVANHLSYEHPYFVDALAKAESPYREHFVFDESEIGYRTYFGVRSMPQINLTNEATRKWMFDIARFWLTEFEVDGFRLDHAQGPGPEFWTEFQMACKQANPESFCFAEVVEPPSEMLRYAGRVDGLLDFNFNETVRRAYGYGSITMHNFDIFLRRHLDFFRESGMLLPTFLDNHDMKRFLFIAGEDKQKLRAAAELQFKLPGPPIIYYGTEVGMSEFQTDDPHDRLVGCRAPMDWGKFQDRELFAFYQSLIRRRAQDKPWKE
ncbi:MAG: alpha-amylase family glycosyl hydrolase [Chloroflexi bacterium]|nr:alpha-amylase family glycosyl hydrolase [Chloroflexota bacterium]